MRVQRVLMPGSGAESWTVLGDDQVPVEPVERFLGYLSSIEKSPNTVKAYAHDLKDWFIYLSGHDLDWQVVTVEDVAGFVAWLRLPPAGRDGKVVVLPTVAHHCSAASVNRKLAALTSFVSSMPATGWSLPGCWSRCSRPDGGALGRRRRTSRFCIMSPRAGRSGGERSS
ncbi:MAG: site-specific integrase [Pseudonocardiales bacterium]|nr:site-specific integrase [Pseudonocardiales bacterium]